MTPKLCRALGMLLVTSAFTAIAVPEAHAIQASGSLLVVPSKQIDLLKDDIVTIDVYFRNTSTQTPLTTVVPPTVANEAILNGPVTVDLGCEDCGCTTKNTSALTFLNCDVLGAGVTGCTAGAQPDQVLINIQASGVQVGPNDSPVHLARLRVRVDIDDMPFLGTRAATSSCAVVSCADLIQRLDCASCAATGCSFLRGTSPRSGILACKHGCINRIEFPQDPNKLDKMSFSALVHVPGYNPAAESFTLRVTKDGMPVFPPVTVPMVPQTGNPRVYELNGTGSDTQAGFKRIEITRRTGTGAGGVDCTDDWFKIIVETFDDMTLAQMKDPTLKVEVVLDNRPPLVNQEPWESFPNNAVGTDIRTLKNDYDERSPC